MAQRPLAICVLSFAAGIALYAVARPLAPLALLTLLCCLVLFALTRRALWSLAALLLAFGALGFVHAALHAVPAPDDISLLAPATVTLTGRIASDVEAPAGAARRQSLAFTLAVQEAALHRGSAGEAIANASGNVKVRLLLASVYTADGMNSHEPLVPRYGDLLRVQGRLETPQGPRNPGGFDEQTYLARNGVYATLTARHPQDWQIVRAEATSGNPLLRLVFGLRERLLHHARAVLPPERASALNGILLGTRADLPGSLNDAFERTGTSHLLATAGLHVGIVTGLLLGGLRLLRVPKRPGLFAILLLLWLYALMAGGRPSVVRAVIVASVYLLGTLLEREPDLTNALAVGALGLLLYNPQNLFEAGFQLSFATVVTIALLMPFAAPIVQSIRQKQSSASPVARVSYRLAEIVADGLLLAIAAQIGSAPLVAYYFNTVSVVSLIANTLVVPLTAVLIALGFGAAVVGLVSPILAWPLDRTLEALLSVVIGTITECAHLPFASFAIASPPFWLLLAYYALLWSVAWRWRPALVRDSGKESLGKSRLAR